MTELLDALRAAVGDSHVLTGDDAAPFARDWTGAWEGQPLAAVRPGSTAEVAAVVRSCVEADMAVVPVSGNTSLMGGTYAPGKVALSLERMSRVRKIKTGARVAVVEAGVVLSSLHEAADAEGLVFPLTFGAKGSARVGGLLGTNAGGSNVLRYGNVRDLCLGIEVVLPDGRVLDLMGELHKDNSGYDLRDLFIGAEGTLGVITAAVLRLHPKPRAYATAMVAVPRVGAALGLLNRLQAATGGAVEAFEYMPDTYVEAHLEHVEGARPPFAERHAHGVMVEVGATSEADATPDESGALPVEARLEAVLGELMETGEVVDAVVARSEAQRREMWARRELAGELTVAGGPSVLTDIAVPLDAVETFLERAYADIEAADPGTRHLVVSHLGDGNVHLAVWPRTITYDAVMEIVEDIVADLGGSFSAEHGVGIGKMGAMRRRKDPVALELMGRIKRALDPQGLMNPGKLLP